MNGTELVLKFNSSLLIRLEKTNRPICITICNDDTYEEILITTSGLIQIIGYLESEPPQPHIIVIYADSDRKCTFSKQNDNKYQLHEYSLCNADKEDVYVFFNPATKADIVRAIPIIDAFLALPYQ